MSLTERKSRSILSLCVAVWVLTLVGVAAPMAFAPGVSADPRTLAVPRFGSAKSVNATGAESAPTALVQEKGKFRVLVGGQVVGREEFEIAPSGDAWVAQGSAQIEVPKGTHTHLTSNLKLKPDGTPVRYDWSIEGTKKASSTVEFQGQTVTIQLNLQGSKPFTQQFVFNSPRIAILDNNFYHQYAILTRLYDWKTKGAQTFAVLIPQEMTPGNVTVEFAGPQDVEGKKLDMLRVKSADLEINLYVDESQRLVRISVPSSNAEAIRE